MNNQIFAEKFGSWAVVTGASSGIGTGFARGVAAKGLNVVLVGRREGRLKEVADELETIHQVQTQIVATDLTDDAFLTDIRQVTDPLDIGLVISNAGAGVLGAMLKVDVEDLASTLKLNTTAHLHLAHHFGKRLVKKGRGGILLVGSMAGMQGTPLAGDYAGAKAYIHNLGQALNYELRRTGVHVSVTVPGPVNSPALNDRTDIDLGKMPGPVMSVNKLVAIGLKGLAKNKPLLIAGGTTRVMDFMFRRVLPRQVGRNMMGMMMTKYAPAELTM